jgi:hypothetical protein
MARTNTPITIRGLISNRPRLIPGLTHCVNSLIVSYSLLVTRYWLLLAGSCTLLPASCFLSATLSRAERERGLAAISCAVGRIGLRVINRNVARWPHVQTGTSGGQMQSRLSRRMNSFTKRSSNEWKLTTTSRPPGARISTACGSAASIAANSSLTAMRSAWKVRVAGGMR